jgi:murein DD-endopeptidase MepM/ murein hydrolase activator NlpD
MNLPLLILSVLALLACPLAAAQGSDDDKYPFRIDEFRSSQKAWFVAVNNSPATITVSFGLTGSNFNADKGLPVTLVVSPHSSQDIVHITQAVRWEPMRYGYRYSFQPGDPFSPPAGHARYILPFEKGQRFLVVQSPDSVGGTGTLITHNNDYSRFAFDFGVSEGTLVTAARDGIVIDVKDSFTLGGPNPAFNKKANYVAIMHEDRSVSYYVHLAPRRVFVRPGQQVRAGNPVGYSGNTGYTHGPHLHFDVRRADVSENGDVVHMSVPVDFYQRDGLGEKILIEEGMLIKAP